MLPAAETSPDVSRRSITAAPEWRLPTRIAFRFGVFYFGLYVVTTQMLGSMLPLPNSSVPDITSAKWTTALFSWVGRHVMHVSGEIMTRNTGSGDRTLDWAQMLVTLAVAAVGTLVWSLLTRRRSHPAVQKWFTVFLRFAVGATMFTYGFAKVFPLQMPPPSLQRLLEPYGNFSPMGVLWYSVGASPAYEMFVGSAEAAGGLLLMIPPLATLGAIVTLADVIEVFVLNMTYDVPVKLFSFHLILMALFLLAPEMRRLLSAVALNRAVGPSSRRHLFDGRLAMRMAIAFQLVFAAYLLAMNVYGGWHGIRERARLKSPLYGIWDITELSTDGQPRPPLLTDANRWRRAVFQVPASMSFQLMNDSASFFMCAIDVTANTLTLTKGAGDRNWKATFAITRPDAESMTLDGTMDGHHIQARLHRLDHTGFLLLSRGFHWISEAPFNR